MKNAWLTIGLIFILSCSKTDTIIFPPATHPLCFDCNSLERNYQDSTEHPTILGEKFSNPYTINNMDRAYRNVYGKSPPALGTTHLYVKFSPRDFSELDRLEQEDIDLFDYPLDLELISEGDYYEQPGKGEEDIPDYYAVVESNFRFPEGIRSEVVERMHIPGDDPAWENEALKLTNTLFDHGPLGPKSEANDPPENTTAQYADCSQHPSGRLLLRHELNNDRSLHPVPGVRIVIRRLLKVESLYTDENGEFRSSKHFRNKYTILAKFKNGKANISRTRPKRIYEQFFPVKINLGKWDHLDCLHEFRIEHIDQTGTVATSHWCAATAHHALANYHQLCGRNSISPPPLKLNIILSSKKGAGNGNTYMLKSIMTDNSAAMIGGEVMFAGALAVMNPIAGLATLAAMEFTKTRAPDIHYGYGGDPSFLKTDRYNELVMHELSHASHYQSAGTMWWAKFGVAEFSNKGEGTYGSCCTEKAGRIALGEAWAYTIGHLFTDQEYGMRSTAFPEQGHIDEMRNVLFYSNQGSLSSHLHFLEAFDPKRETDPSYWVPKGLFYDMMDPQVELFSSSGIRDGVTGFKCRQIFSLLNKDTRDIYDFRIKFIKKYGGIQSNALEDLFAQYGY